MSWHIWSSEPLPHPPPEKEREQEPREHAEAKPTRTIQPAASPNRRAQTLRQLQHTYGNHRIQQLVANLRGGGRPLDAVTRRVMESALGANFENVRVHTESEAQAAAAELGVRAFTEEQDIYFAAEAYDPASSTGFELLAHELAHVIQQQRGGASPPGLEHEEDADRAASAVQSGLSGSVTKASAPGVAQFAPNDDLDKLLKFGPKVEVPTAEELQAVLARSNAGTATAADQEILLRQTIAESRAYLEAGAGRPLSYDVLKGNCGPGRDVSAASFGSLTSDSPKPSSIFRFQSQEVFGVNKHGFSVVTFSDSAQYLVDPTFGQFLRPGMAMDPLKQATAQVLRTLPGGDQIARDLVQNGFIRLTPESARLYARALGVPKADAAQLAARLFNGENAVLTELLGGGAQTTFKVGAGGPDVLDRADLVKFLREEHIPNLEKAGDPNKQLPRLRQLLRRLQESPAKVPPILPGVGGPGEGEGPGGEPKGKGGGGGGGILGKLLFAVGAYFSGKHLYEAGQEGREEFGLAVAEEGMIWGSALTPLGPAGPLTVGFASWYAESFAYAMAVVLPELARLGAEAYETLSEAGQRMMVGLFLRPIILAHESLNPQNWDTRSMPEDLVAPTNQLGTALWAKLEPLNMDDFRDSLLRPVSDFGLPTDMLAQYSKATFASAPLGSMTPIQLLKSLKMNKLRFVQDPEYLADVQSYGKAPTLGKVDAGRLHYLVEARASINPYNWDLGNFAKTSTHDQDIANLNSLGIALWAELKTLDQEGFRKMSLEPMSAFKLSPEQVQNAATALTRSALAHGILAGVEVTPELIEYYKVMFLNMTPQDLIKFLKEWANLRFKQDPASVAIEAIEAVKQGYQPW